MERQKVEISYENFVCRIPAMFAYIEADSDGEFVLHKATDSTNGSYGKIVENIHTPANVRLTNYVSVQKETVPSSYQWNDASTIGISEDENAVFSKSLSQFLRKVIWYSYVKTEDEGYDYVYLETIPQDISDDSPQYVKTDKVGVDGVQIECGGEQLYDYFEKKGEYLYFQRMDIIEPCKTYSYRTLIETYYKYRTITPVDNTFIKFIETGIGLLHVDRKLLRLTDERKYPDVPQTVYLSQIKLLKADYDELKKASDYYIQHMDSEVKISSALKEKHQEYIRKGGDNMRNWISQMVPKSYEVANEYKCHAENRKFSVRVNLNVMLSNKTAVNGIETVCVNEFIPGNRYYDGDLLTYEGRTYICLLGRCINGGDNYPYILKSDKYKKVLYKFNNQDGYIRIGENNLKTLPSTYPLPTYKISDFVSKDGVYYFWTVDGNSGYYSLIDVTEYICGKWDSNRKRYVFDTQHFVLLSEIDDSKKWYDDANTDGDYYRFFEDLDYVPSLHECEYVRFNNSVYGWSEETQTYVPTDGESYDISENTNSKLRSLRTFKEYTNELGVFEEPDLTQDWLYYYKVGTITGLMTETDSIGNIINDTHDYIGVCYNLHAYGNIITSITYDEGNNTVTFNYVIGAHLLAEYDGQTMDEDGNIKRCYKNFTYDNESKDGIVFSETYTCSDNSIGNLGNDFDSYVNGDLQTMMRHTFERFPFNTVPVNTMDGKRTVIGKGVKNVEAYADMLHTNTVKEDWMRGLYHQPKLKSSLLIDRGNGASYERHIRLGEIRTMEDFVNYQNGGYFKITEN